MEKLIKILSSQFDPQKFIWKRSRVWSDASVLKNKPSLTPVPQDLMTAILHRYQAHMYMQTKHLHQIK